MPECIPQYKNNLKNPFLDEKHSGIEEPISSMDANIDGLVFTTDNGLFEYSFLYNQLNQIETQIELNRLIIFSFVLITGLVRGNVLFI